MEFEDKEVIAEKALNFLLDHPELAKEIFDSELSMPNIPTKTMGGNVVWTTLAEVNGLKLQQNQITHHARILNADNVRIAWGTVNGMQKAVRRIANISEQLIDEKVISEIEPELLSIKSMLDKGILTQEEFDAQKKRILSKIH